MNRTFAFFFLILMTLSVAVPLMKQLRGSDLYELSELPAEDADEKGKTEHEKEKEKEKEEKSLSFSNSSALQLNAFNLDKLNKSLFSNYDFPVSELYASLPELPPEA